MIYTCEHCKRTFGDAWDGAEKEFAEKFQGADIDDAVRVCDDCYRILVARLKVLQQ